MHRAVIHMPSWFPGAGFKRTARKWYPIVDGALQMTYDKVKGDLVSCSGVSRLVRRDSRRQLNAWFNTSHVRLPERPLHLFLQI